MNYSICKIELIININDNINSEFMKYKLVKYHKQCEINKAPKDTLSRIKIILISTMFYRVTGNSIIN